MGIKFLFMALGYYFKSRADDTDIRLYRESTKLKKHLEAKIWENRHGAPELTAILASELSNEEHIRESLERRIRADSDSGGS